MAGSRKCWLSMPFMQPLFRLINDVKIYYLGPDHQNEINILYDYAIVWLTDDGVASNG